MLAAGMMLRAGLNDLSMWLDEVNMVHATLGWNPLDYATYGNGGHPPLYFILLRGWMAIAGQGDLVLRTLTLLTAVLTAAIIYRIGADFTHKASGGAIAALLFGGMGFVKYYVHETHNYAQLMLFCMALLFFAGRWWGHPGRRVYAVGVVLSAAGLIYTHYYSIYFLIALNVGVLIFAWRRWGQWLRWIGLELIAAVLYTPWLLRIAMIVQRILARRANGQIRIPTAISTSSKTIAEAIATLLSDQVILYAIAIALGLAGLIWLYRTRRGDARRLLPRLAVLLVIIIGSAALAFIVNRFYKTFTPRRIIYVLPTFAVLVACLLTTLPRWLRWPAALIVTAVTAWYGWSTVQPGNWYFRQAVESVRGELQPGDLVVLSTADYPNAGHGRPLIYYAETLLPKSTVQVTLGAKPTIGTPDSDNDFANRVFAPAVVTHPRFWVISALDPGITPVSLEWVGKLKLGPYQPRQATTVGLFKVSLFERAPTERAAMPEAAVLSPQPLMAQVFGDTFELDRVQIDRVAASPGDTISIWLDWQAIRRPDQNYAVFVHLLADPTTIITQDDGDPTHLGIAAPTSLWAILTPVYDTRQITVPAGTPPGRYALRLGIYSRITGQRLPVVPADGTISDSLLLTMILIR